MYSIGDRVRLLESSHLQHQSEGTAGIITAHYPAMEDEEEGYDVNWDNGYKNWYKPIWLEYAEPSTLREVKEVILKKPMRLKYSEALEKGLFVVGATFRTNVLSQIRADETDIMLGEISGNTYYFFHNVDTSIHNSWHNNNPKEKGFKYVWNITKAAMRGFSSDFWVDFESAFKVIEGEVPATLTKMEKSIEIMWARKDGLTTFEFKVDPKITKSFEKVSEEIKESKNWKGLKFFYCPKVLNSPSYQERLKSYRLFDDYGSGIYRNGCLNIAWLRTVGGQGTIEVEDPITVAELSSLIKNSIAFLKEYLQETMKDFELKGVLNLVV